MVAFVTEAFIYVWT